jgi:uncharacterized protein (UPF0335 family)
MVLFSSLLWSQDLKKENSWSISENKKNVYFDQGIFKFAQDNKAVVTVQKIRTHYNDKTKEERIVLDLDSSFMPSVYGYISKDKNKLNIDLMQGKKEEKAWQNVAGKYLESIDIYQISPNLISFELKFKSTYTFEIFYLSSPTRLVIDVKK